MAFQATIFLHVIMFTERCTLSKQRIKLCTASNKEHKRYTTGAATVNFHFRAVCICVCAESKYMRTHRRDKMF